MIKLLGQVGDHAGAAGGGIRSGGKKALFGVSLAVDCPTGPEAALLAGLEAALLAGMEPALLAGLEPALLAGMGRYSAVFEHQVARLARVCRSEGKE